MINRDYLYCPKSFNATCKTSAVDGKYCQNMLLYFGRTHFYLRILLRLRSSMSSLLARSLVDSKFACIVVPADEINAVVQLQRQ